MAGRHGGPGPADRTPLESLLATALRADAAGTEDRALAAFRDARDTGAHRAARTRRRDDWRPRRPARRITLSVLAASLTLGGVAYAAIDAGRGPAAEDPGRHPDRPSASASAAPAPARPSPSRTAAQPAPDTPAETTAAPDRPAPAQDTEAHCRAYERLPDRTRDATAWQRLIEAAGGADEVAAYCARLTAPPAPRTTAPGRPTDPGKPGRTPAEDHPGRSGDNGRKK
ncbi:hypothetical protein ABZ397_00170 [Streptomyces sp. NPDC005876]|uniref:hypothetical protein n=1 Tax=Streptomyces sp. NPDC005876 TaxID=3157076 RepID=UPI0033E7D446